jgi:D-3-phosphoglycerate dehydrogenase
MIDHMRVVVVGDRFVGVDLFEDALMRYVAPLVAKLEIVGLELDWPDVPMISNAEIKEYAGTPEAVAALVPGAYALVTHVAPVTRSVFDAGQALRIIGCCRSGTVNINVAAASERGIPVVNAPGRNAPAVVEFTLGLILAERRGIARAHAGLIDGVWRGDLYRYDRAGRELGGQTIGLIGLGVVAQALVPCLKPFGLRVLTYDPYVPAARCAELGVEQVDLEVLLQESDIVSLHARLTPQTAGMIGRHELALMKSGAYLINTARGGLVDHDALYDALASGHLGGAALDCLPSEPPAVDWPMLKLQNVTLTPHIAGASQGSAHRGAEDVVRDVANFMAGRPLAHCVNGNSVR